MIEYQHRVEADSGFRILKLDSSPLVVDNVREIHSDFETDLNGTTAESIVWTIPADERGKPIGRYSANLSIVQRHPKGSRFLALTGLFDLQENQSVALQIPESEIALVDALQLIGPDGHVLAELQRDTSKVVKEVSRWFSLRAVNRGLVLQTGPASGLQ